MKKLLSLLLVFMFLTLSACGNAPVNGNVAADKNISTEVNFGNNFTDGNIPAEVQYGIIEALYKIYDNAREIVDWEDSPERTRVIFAGKVNAISFQVLDITTAKPPDEKTEERHRQLHTTYDVDIITAYKGELPESIRIKVDSGIKDYRAEEQLRLIKEMKAWPEDCIPISEGLPEIKIGESYLFVCSQYNDGSHGLINMDQSVYDLRDPFKKNVIRNREPDEPAEYYSRDTDRLGFPLISAKDVISAFGEDKWDAFWADWQEDNPDWETWLDKSAVEMVLAEK